MIAIMHGLEVGLSPLSALQRIAVINGRPTIWGDGALALVKASGLCEATNFQVLCLACHTQKTKSDLSTRAKTLRTQLRISV